MRKRRKMRKGLSRKLFTRGAQRVHRKNDLAGFVSRGGIRL